MDLAASGAQNILSDYGATASLCVMDQHDWKIEWHGASEAYCPSMNRWLPDIRNQILDSIQ